MNASNRTHYVAKGETVCIPSTWTDVVKFFLLNYGLHALTVITKPGSGTPLTIATMASAIIMPYYGIAGAIRTIVSFPIRLWKNSLSAAAEAGALCMVVRAEDVEDSDHHWERVSPMLTDIHGQHPVRVMSLTTLAKDWLWRPPKALKNEGLSEPCLVQVPPYFVVKPLSRPLPNNPSPVGNLPPSGGQNTENTQFRLSYVYDIIKAIAAILQILYGAYELSKTRKPQLEKYGAAAYSLTVIPYVLMSVANLLAGFCVPQYPTLFMVLCTDPQILSGKAGGTVKEKLQEPKPSSDSIRVIEQGKLSIEEKRNWQQEINGNIYGSVGEIDEKQPGPPKFWDKFRLRLLSISLLVCWIAAPHIIIWFLSGYRPSQNYRDRQIWFYLWLSVGQIYGVVAHFYHSIHRNGWEARINSKYQGYLRAKWPKCYRALERMCAFKQIYRSPLFVTLLYMCIMLLFTVHGFYEVARMILDDEICTVI